MQFPIFIKLHRSRLLDFLLVLLHGGSRLSICDTVTTYLAISDFCLVSFSAWRTLAHQQEIYSVQLTAQGSLICCQQDGTCVETCVLSDSTISRYLVVLRLQKRRK